jgi:Fe2+ transport system protein B
MTVEDVVDKVKDVLTRMKELDVIVNETSEKLWERVEIPALDFSGIRAETKVQKTMKLPVVRARRVEINEKRIEKLILRLEKSITFEAIYKNEKSLLSYTYELKSSSMKYLIETILFIRENYETLMEVLERLVKEAEQAKKEIEEHADAVKKVKALLEIAFS